MSPAPRQRCRRFRYRESREAYQSRDAPRRDLRLQRPPHGRTAEFVPVDLHPGLSRMRRPVAVGAVPPGVTLCQIESRRSLQLWSRLIHAVVYRARKPPSSLLFPSTRRERWCREQSLLENCRPRFIPAEFRDILFETDTREATPNAAAQWHRGEALRLHSIAKNIPNFLLHAVAVTTCPLLESRLHVLFQISNDQLRHGNSSPR